jgi:hypothetical protein
LFTLRWSVSNIRTSPPSLYLSTLYTVYNCSTFHKFQITQFKYSVLFKI